MSYAESEYIISEITNALPLLTGSGMPPLNTDFEIKSRDHKFLMLFTPHNTVLDNKTVCVPNKLIIVFNSDHSPEDLTDGTVIRVIDENEIWTYSSNFYTVIDDAFVADTNYYVRVFTISDQNICNLEPNVKQCVYDIQSPPIIYGYHQDFRNQDPDEMIVYHDTNKSFIPVHGNVDTGEITYGTWGSWSWLQKIRPYWLDEYGNVKYAIDPNNYGLKIDGTISDIGNAEAKGGAFVWFPAIFIKVIEAADGLSRDVYFSERNDLEEVSDFENYCFYDYNGIPTKGLWIPMFYPVRTDSANNNAPFSDRTYSLSNIPVGTNMLHMVNNSNSDTSSSYYKIGILSTSFIRQIAQYMYPNLTNKSTRLGLCNLTFTFLVRDLIYMLGKSTNINDTFGRGIKGYSFTENSITITKNYLEPKDFIGEPLKHGMFYGTDDSAFPSTLTKARVEKRKACKIFHSYILGTCCIPFAIDCFIEFNSYIWTGSVQYYNIYAVLNPFANNSNQPKLLIVNNTVNSFGDNAYLNVVEGKLFANTVSSLSTGTSITGLCTKHENAPKIGYWWSNSAHTSTPSIAIGGGSSSLLTSYNSTKEGYNIASMSTTAIDGAPYTTIVICICPESADYEPV